MYDDKYFAHPLNSRRSACGGYAADCFLLLCINLGHFLCGYYSVTKREHCYTAYELVRHTCKRRGLDWQ